MHPATTRMGNNRSFLPGDHPSASLRTRLGSIAITANSSGSSIGELRYKAWGETRFSSGTTYTKRHFTGQYQESTLGGLEGLYFYNSRWYDRVTPQLGISLLSGQIEGDKLTKYIGVYEGTAMVGGGSLGPFSGEMFKSIDPLTGVVDNQISGAAFGICWGVPPVEGHIYESKAIFQKSWSDLFTDIGQKLGLLDEK